MKINGKRYCDVCGRRIIGDFDGAYYGFECGKSPRDYCLDHTFIGDNFLQICSGEEDVFINDRVKDNCVPAASKEVSNLELYDILSGLFEKHCGYLASYAIIDKDIVKHYKNLLAADINYNRLIAKGKIENKEKEETEC